jgi:hypothetical protein
MVAKQLILTFVKTKLCLLSNVGRQALSNFVANKTTAYL